MIISTANFVAGHRVRETLGTCFGVVVRSRGLGGNLLAGLRSLAGGEIKEYTVMLEDARRQALDRMVVNARAMGADAVITVRFDSSELGQTMSEVVAYGTAVRLEAVDAARAGLASEPATSATADPGRAPEGRQGTPRSRAAPGTQGGP